MTRTRCRCLTLTPSPTPTPTPTPTLTLTLILTPTPTLSPTPPPGEMPLHKLSRQGCLEATRGIIDILIKTDSVKIDLNWQDKQGKTPIFYAIEYGHKTLAQNPNPSPNPNPQP